MSTPTISQIEQAILNPQLYVKRDGVPLPALYETIESWGARAVQELYRRCDDNKALTRLSLAKTIAEGGNVVLESYASVIQGCPTINAVRLLLRRATKAEDTNKHSSEACKEICDKILTELAGASVCTPMETYGTDVAWAVRDLIAAWKIQRPITHDVLRDLKKARDLALQQRDEAISHNERLIKENVKLATLNREQHGVFQIARNAGDRLRQIFLLPPDAKMIDVIKAAEQGKKNGADAREILGITIHDDLIEEIRKMKQALIWNKQHRKQAQAERDEALHKLEQQPIDKEILAKQRDEAVVARAKAEAWGEKVHKELDEARKRIEQHEETINFMEVIVEGKNAAMEALKKELAQANLTFSNEFALHRDVIKGKDEAIEREHAQTMLFKKELDNLRKNGFFYVKKSVEHPEPVFRRACPHTTTIACSLGYECFKCNTPMIPSKGNPQHSRDFEACTHRNVTVAQSSEGDESSGTCQDCNRVLKYNTDTRNWDLTQTQR